MAEVAAKHDPLTDAEKSLIHTVLVNNKLADASTSKLMSERQTEPGPSLRPEIEKAKYMQVQANPVMQVLANRIERAILQKERYHAVIAIPVHPEGLLDDVFVMKMIHLNMQTLHNGQHSLINRIRVAILVRRELDKGPYLPSRETENKVKLLKGIYVGWRSNDLDDAVGDEWRQWLTLLNLRTWKTLASSETVTEQIYIHSKTVIADDNFAVVGSCNVNDRSQMGNRDSELGVLIHDTAQVDVQLDGVIKRKVSRVVHEMRVSCGPSCWAAGPKNWATPTRPRAARGRHPWRAMRT